MFFSLNINNEQAELLGKKMNGCIAKNHDHSEFYLNIEHARDIEELDSLLMLIPDIERLIVSGAKVIQLVK